jgi:hypothetical protein
MLREPRLNLYDLVNDLARIIALVCTLALVPPIVAAALEVVRWFFSN